MKRLAAVLAAALLVTGCFHDDDCFEGSVTIEWFDFLAADGVPVSCGGAGVDFIDIFVDGQAVDQRFFCSDGGATIVGVPRGQHVFTVEGVQATGFADLGQIVNRDEFTIDARCGDRFVSVQPAAGVANLNYSAEGGCSTPPCYLWFSVFDVTANRVTAAITKDSFVSEQRLFEYPGDVAIELPAGPHTLQWMELVSEPAGFDVEASRCTPTPFDVVPGVVTLSADIPLAEAGPACH